MRALPSIRAFIAWAVLTTSVATFALVSAPQAEAATTTTYTVTTTVNVRSAKSSKATIVGQIAAGKHVLASGKAKSGWLPIKFNAKTAYIATKYLKKDAKAASVVISGPVGKKTSIKQVPIRVKAKVTADAVKVAPKGTVMQVTGETSGIYTKVTVAGVNGWASTRRLTTKTVILPDVVASYTTTASLALRTSASASATNQVTIPTGSTVGGSGKHSGSYSQVVYSGRVGWVITGYLKAVDGTDASYVLPLRATTVYATYAVSLLQSATAEATVVGKVAVGVALRGTGDTKNAYTAVIWNGTVAWVESAKVTVSLGSSSLDKLESNGKAAVIEIRPLFPKITTIYGWRASSSYSSDHPNGRAVDFMIPSYKTNKALGDALAAYVIANGKRLHVTYLIWQQRSYTLTRGTWKAMEDRGGDTANHMDHVHVSFEPSSK
jgi:uncharacterized protein YgiM (DUF1202 family)